MTPNKARHHPIRLIRDLLLYVLRRLGEKGSFMIMAIAFPSLSWGGECSKQSKCRIVCGARVSGVARNSAHFSCDPMAHVKFVVTPLTGCQNYSMTRPIKLDGGVCSPWHCRDTATMTELALIYAAENHCLGWERG